MAWIFPWWSMAWLSMAASPLPVAQEVEPASDIPAAPDILDIEIDRTDRMTVPVTIDGNGPYSFLIDTGSERTVVSRRLATALDLEFAAQAQLLSMAGIQIVDTVYVPELELGRQNYGEVIAPLLEPRYIGAEGILGLDGLQDQRILFNFVDNKIEIEDNRKSSVNRGYEIVVTAKRREGQLIFTDATLDGIKIDVVIDTGAQSSIGNRALQDKLRGRKAKGTDDPSKLTSVTGQTIWADSGIVPDFQIGKVQIDYIPIAFADAPPFKTLGLEKKPALFLGMATLRAFDRVAIDFGKRKVYFDLPGRTPRRRSQF